MTHDAAIALIDETLAGLKDFQIATVKSVLDSYSQGCSQRVLVADEVGLGKTIVAKGVIAELLKAQLRISGDLGLTKPLRVTYICSNQTLARENRAKLAVFKGSAQNEYVQEPSYGRLITTALTKNNHQSAKGKLLEVCSLTPSTSFNLTRGDGNWRERMIILCALVAHPELRVYKNQLRRFWQGAISSQKWWDQKHEDYEKERTLQPKILIEFHRLLSLDISDKDTKRCGIDFNGSWIDLLNNIATGGCTLSKPQRVRACMRVLMARACSKNISADLFILDEFQRFKGLLNTETESEESIIASQIFSSQSGKNSKVLLLSATPFKAFSQSHDDENGDAHSGELRYLLNFISDSNHTLLAEYQEHREALQRQILSLKDATTNLENLDNSHKSAIEVCLQPLICRTERSQVSEGYEAIFSPVDGICNNSFSVKDINSFKAMDVVGEALQEVSRGRYRSQLMEFYKAAPWALSFLSGYQFKKQLDIKGYEPVIRKALKKSSAAWLSRKAIADYSLKLSDAPHAKTKALTEYLFSSDSEKLLWVPPSLPHYPLQGCFEGQENFSKTLLFSSWAMVPRALSGLVSYEAERRLAKHQRKNERDYYKTHHPKIKFDQSSSLSGWSLIYPAQSLMQRQLSNDDKPLSEIIDERRGYFVKQLDCLKVFEKGKRSGDRWYALAPMLLDRENGFTDVLNSWIKRVQENVSHGANNYQLKEIRTYLDSGDDLALGEMPLDLAEYLAYLSVASPAVCAARTWRRLWINVDEQLILQAATRVAFGAVSLFNKAESERIIHILYGKKKYFLAIARYCAEGDFQAVVDEYGHLLFERGIEDATIKFTETLSFSPTRVNCQFEQDKLKSSIKISGNEKQTVKHSLRCHYAVPLGNQKLTDESGVKRIGEVRDAFNSPFRPFMLNSTSIGQEGLDFHWYCRQIVHWNLPSNPIDIEQREGRVNRYKSLVVRNRVAQAYGNGSYSNSGDPWAALFATADEDTKSARKSDLVPYWHYPQGEATIERYVPMMPMSKEVGKLDNALKVLVLYRLAFGQPRQEELLDNLLKRKFTENEIKQINKQLTINLSPLMHRKEKVISAPLMDESSLENITQNIDIIINRETKDVG